MEFFWKGFDDEGWHGGRKVAKRFLLANCVCWLEFAACSCGLSAFTAGALWTMKPILITALLFASCAIGVASKPNVIIVITDDQGYGDLSITGNPLLKTPNIDRLAREGVLPTNAFLKVPHESSSLL